MSRKQISVPITEEQRAFLERVAAEQDRTVASTVRRLIAEAARKSEPQERAA